MALSKVDLANQVENQLPQNLVANNLPFRNIIINGDMSIAQRGTSVSSVTSTSYNTVDRWNNYISSLGTWTVSQDTTVPTGQGFAKSLKYDCTTADASPASNDVNILIQRFEGQNLQYLKKGTSSAESLTLSFWVRSNKTGTYTCEIYDADNTRYIGKTYTIDVADTWEKKTITFDGDTTGALDNDNAYSLSVLFWLGAGTDFTGGTFNNGTWGAGGNNTRVSSSQVNLADSTANEWYVTGVQLEAGTSASDFEFLPVDVNLQRCQRYFEICDPDRLQGSQTYVSSTLFCNPLEFSVTKRAVPTITNSSATFFLFYNPSYDTGVSWSLDSANVNSFRITMNSTRDYGFVGSGTDYFKADAEL